MIEVRFSGSAKSMWRRIPNPQHFFTSSRGWYALPTAVTYLRDDEAAPLVLLSHHFVKNGIHAHYVETRPGF